MNMSEISNKEKIAFKAYLTLLDKMGALAVEGIDDIYLDFYIACFDGEITQT